MPNHKQIRRRAVHVYRQEARKQRRHCGDGQQESALNSTTTPSLSVNLDTKPSESLSRIADQEHEKTAGIKKAHRRREMSPEKRSKTNANNARGSSPTETKESSYDNPGRSLQGKHNVGSHALMLGIPSDAATRETTTYESFGQEKAVDTGAVSFDSSADDHHHKGVRKQVDTLVPKTVTIEKESEMKLVSSSNVADDAAELAFVSGEPSESERSESEFHSISAGHDAETNRDLNFLATTALKATFRSENSSSTSVTIEEDVDEKANAVLEKRHFRQSDDNSIAESIPCRTYNRSSFATGTAVKKLCEKRGCWITGEVADCEVSMNAICRVQFNVEGSIGESFRIRSTPKDLDLLEKMVKLGRVRSGARVNIFRSEENVYCPASVLQERPQHMKAFFVQYEDGESEWINLWFHKFEVLADAPIRKKIKSSSGHAKCIRIKEEREQVSKESQRAHNGIDMGEPKGLLAVPLEEMHRSLSSKGIEKVVEDEGTATCLENTHGTDEVVDSEKDEGTCLYVERKHLKRKRNIDDASHTDDKEVVERKKSFQGGKGSVENNLVRKVCHGKTKTSRVRSKAAVEASKAVDDGEESTVDEDDSSEELVAVIRGSLISVNMEKTSGNQVDSVSDVVDSNFPEKSGTRFRAEVEPSASRLCGKDVSEDVGLNVDFKKSQNHQEADREVAVGDRVGIYWEGDKRYYYGKVTRHEKGKKKPFFLEYDDGESEWVDFSKSKYRFEKKKVSDRAKVADESSSFFKSTDQALLSKIDASLPQPSARTTRRSLNTTEVDVDTRIRPALVSDGAPTTRKKRKVTKDNDSDLRNCELAEIKVGIRVAVWWPDDRRYYEGVVSKKQPEASWRPFYLEYDDGEAEWIDFRQHKFKILRVDDEEKTAGPSTGKAADPCSDPSKVWIGTRLSVWWPQEEEYFDCTVTRYRDHKRPFYLEYEDGDREWIDLTEHKFFIIESETSRQRRKGKQGRFR